MLPQEHRVLHGFVELSFAIMKDENCNNLSFVFDEMFYHWPLDF